MLRSCASSSRPLQQRRKMSRDLTDIIADAVADRLAERQAADLLTISDVCVLLSLSRSTVNRMIRDGSIPTHKVGKRAVRIRREDIVHLAAPKEGT